MLERVVQATAFKAKCLALLDEVERTHQTIVVTKRGRPVARLVPLDDEPPASLDGSLHVLVDDEEQLFSTGTTWEADR